MKNLRNISNKIIVVLSLVLILNGYPKNINSQTDNSKIIENP